ncbi:OmpA family protein [Qipengyuania spongiae]|uniref:OmpA family protein n=1 Tax=Qipengyuania spongiae TaxID=2909673 RepID=A0ABY5T3W8_9SPHN|nr:OmpA family protein [Qipengyuania spongiae]UVI40023.1 OmpA family protein [Qipengyuania spongiae]
MKIAIPAATLAILLAGCTVKEAEDEAQDSTLAAGETAVEEEDGAVFADGEAMPLNIVQTHPNGTRIALESIRATPTETLVTMTILNGSIHPVTLNGFGGAYLFSPDGGKLMLEAPANNESLEIPPGQEVRAELVFKGKLTQGGPATLFVNNARYLEDDDSRYPGFRIPMQLTAAAFTEREAKKKSSSLRLIASEPEPAATRSASTISTLRSELKATETERGTLVSLPGDVLFDTDKADIRPAARSTLDMLAQLIKAQPAAKITIEGHTDSQGEDAYNQRLSERRAQAVRDYLKDVRQVPASRMSTRGIGEDRPVAQNMTPDGRENAAGMAKNRRVEVIIGEG